MLKYLVKIKKRGYAVESCKDILEKINSLALPCEALVKEHTVSTNDDAKALAARGVREAVVIALSQSGGRGRMGRTFSSHRGGLYMSYLTRPDSAAADALFLTVYTSVVVADAIERLSGVKVGIKWVNDLLLCGKKICGILTEGAFSANGGLEYAIVGIGVNLHAREYESEIADIASDIETLCGVHIEISGLAAEIAAGLSAFSSADRAKVIEKYRSRSVCIGKRVRVISHGTEYFANCVDISPSGALVVIPEGEEECVQLSSGEISIRF